MISASDYQTSASAAMDRVDVRSATDMAAVGVAEAQVYAILATASAMQDIAAAIDRLAVAVESQPRRG